MRGDEGEGGEDLASRPAAASQGPRTFPDVPRSSPSEPSQSDDDAVVRVALVFASTIMRSGCAAILDARPQVQVVFSDETLEGLGSDEVDVAVVGVRPGMHDETNIVAVLAGRGVSVLAVLPPGLRGMTAIEAGALATVAGTHVTDDELTDAVLALGHASAGRQGECAGGDESAPSESVLRRLSKREREVLAQVASGHTDREVGERLGISMRTVQSHLDRIREKSGRRRRAELTALAYELGLVIPHE